MRSGGNFNPEWGYLAPTPSFVRTARLVLVATAVGATAGAGVVLSLVDHPTATDNGRTAVAAHALVTSVQAATPSAASAAAGAPAAAAAITPAAAQDATVTAPAANAGPAQIAHPAAPTSTVAAAPSAAPSTASAGIVAAPTSRDGASEARPAATPETPAGIAALAETPARSAEAEKLSPDDGAATTPEAAPPKKTARKHAAVPQARTRTANAGPEPLRLGPLLRRLFSPPDGWSFQR